MLLAALQGNMEPIWKAFAFSEILWPCFHGDVAKQRLILRVSVSILVFWGDEGVLSLHVCDEVFFCTELSPY